MGGKITNIRRVSHGIIKCLGAVAGMRSHDKGWLIPYKALEIGILWKIHLHKTCMPSEIETLDRRSFMI